MLLRYACLGVATAFIAPSQRSRTALAARRPDVAHKIEIIDGERLDPRRTARHSVITSTEPFKRTPPASVRPQSVSKPPQALGPVATALALRADPRGTELHGALTRCTIHGASTRCMTFVCSVERACISEDLVGILAKFGPSGR